MKRLHRPNLYGWSVFNPDRDIDFHAVLWVRDDGNIAFDQDNNPISVNNSLLQVCEPGKRGPDGHKIDFPCPLGTALLKGTGFENHGGTGWLTTTAPVAARSEITLRFAIWDTTRASPSKKACGEPWSGTA